MTDRATSSTLNYVLSIAIASLLVTGLLFSGTNFVEGQQTQVVRSELRVIGEQINADLQRADRLVVAGDGPAGATTVRIEQSFPDRLTGRTYDIEVDPASQQLRLSMRNPDIEVTLPVDTRTALSPSTVDGGTVAIRTTGSGALEVTDD
ncbi:DUF7266 family protein [Haloarcula pelagica]|uniref:DUF7266 family protein n=1 Tax=Haloarcula pelagica TaxID=3033389 RepID=UPI0024C3352A|nr:hypothetical protein [Halomicroarcula sp. YJ-61-S]